jgi:hypothetical protein
MALLVPDDAATEMRRLIDIVEEFNKTALGQASPYEVVGVGIAADGTLTLQLRKKAS